MPTYQHNSSDPAEGAEVVTPSDTVELAQYSRALYVGTGGNVAAVIDGTAITFTGVPAGSILPIRTNRVNATNTTATNIVALY